MIHFDTTPTVGTTVSLDGQIYEFRGEVPHTKQDGTATTLLAWKTACPECETQFVVRSTMRSSGFTRRCPDCAKIGKPVKGKRGRKLVVVIRHP